jgi:predicted Zn-dependent peptidase
VTRTVTRSKKELEQVHVCLGARAYPQSHPDRYASYVLNTVLGGSMSSRLFQNVREKRGLVYSISSGITAYSDAGLLSIYAGTSLDSAPEVIRLTLEEIRRLRGEPLGDPELRRGKDHIAGGLVLSLESSGARMSHLARQEIYFGRQFPLEEILDGIEAVSASDVQRVAADVFDGRLGASVLGNLRGWRPRDRELSA